MNEEIRAEANRIFDPEKYAAFLNVKLREQRETIATLETEKRTLELHVYAGSRMIDAALAATKIPYKRCACCNAYNDTIDEIRTALGKPPCDNCGESECEYCAT